MPVRRHDTWFDDYLFVDWSASNEPATGRDSVWLAHGTCDAEGAVVVSAPENPSTRQQACARVRALLHERVAQGRRVLVGFDFAYGLPRSGLPLVAGEGATWADWWARLAEEISDSPANVNNRFDVAAAANLRSGGSPGPFWGVPVARATAALTATRPPPGPGSPSAWRTVEAVLRAAGHRPFSVWQLLGAGCVGSQSLVGIPYLERLRHDPVLAAVTVVWPFQTWTAAPSGQARVVHAEVWPGLVPVDLARHPVRDAAQVIALVEEAARQDLAGTLGAALAAPSGVPEASTEGWVLFVPPPVSP